MPLTPKNRIWYADTTTPLDPPAVSAAEATSIENALNLRSRFNFSWLNQSERENQAGMVNGSTGYQIDTKTEYVFDTVWRLKTSYAEFLSTTSPAPSGSFASPLNLVMQTSLTTDTTFATISTVGSTVSIVFAQPGIYSLAWTMVYPAAGGAGFAMFSPTASTVSPYTVGGYIVNNANHFITTTLPFLRTTTTNQQVWMYSYINGAATTATNTLRVGRIS